MLDRDVAWSGPAISLLFAVHCRLSESLTCISTARAHKVGVSAAGACRACALVVAARAFSDVVVTFRGRCKGNLLVKSTFRDRRKGSERFYFKRQISWQAQHFGHGGDL